VYVSARRLRRSEDRRSAVASEIDNDAETIALIRYSLATVAPPNTGVTITITGVPSRLAIVRGPINEGAASSSGYAPVGSFLIDRARKEERAAIKR